MSCNSDRSKDSEVTYMGTDHVEMVDSPAYESTNRIYDTVVMGTDNSKNVYDYVKR